MKSEVYPEADENGGEAGHDDGQDDGENEVVDVRLLVGELRSRKGGDDAGAVRQGVEADGGHGNEPVQLVAGNSGGQEQIAEILKGDVLAGRGGAADAGADVGYEDDGEGIDAEVHKAGDHGLEAGDGSDDAAEAGSAADSDEGHNGHGDGAGEEGLEMHTAWKKSVGQSIMLDASMLKRYTGQAAFEVLDDAIQILGGIGYTNGTRIARLWRDQRGARIYAGTEEIMVHSVARALIKQEAGIQ